VVDVARDYNMMYPLGPDFQFQDRLLHDSELRGLAVELVVVYAELSRLSGERSVDDRL